MSAPIDRRRAILDSAVEVFARQGFHAARVSDIANEANVAHGLIYHYFDSKEQILNELFTERWSLLLEALREADQTLPSPREKLEAAASFIVDSYRYDPAVMKVVIVEVTRAANTFGRIHLPEIAKAYEMVAGMVAEAQAAGEMRDDVDPGEAALLFFGAVEQFLSGWIFEMLPTGDEEFESAKRLVVEMIWRGLGPVGASTPGLAGGA